jgi:hypothetical protein
MYCSTWITGEVKYENMIKLLLTLEDVLEHSLSVVVQDEIGWVTECLVVIPSDCRAAYPMGCEESTETQSLNGVRAN